MKPRRVLGVQATNYYHVVSRVVDRRFIFGGSEKAFFRALMRRLSAFSGIRCVTFCLMDNHFHLLLEVSDAEGEAFKAEATLDDVLDRLSAIYRPVELSRIREHYERLRRLRGGGELAAEQYLRAYLDRMYDLSVFVKELKERFTRWYNRRVARVGTLWEGRFRSVLVEGCEDVLLLVAAYIDLNPVRAGIVNDPKDYRWSGYGEAVAGGRSAQQGIRRALGLRSGTEEPCAIPYSIGAKVGWGEAQAAYRKLLYGKGREVRGEDGEITRPGLRGEAVAAVVRSGGRLTIAQALRCRLRYFTAGFAIGRREFLGSVFAEHRRQFGASRSTGERRMRGADWGDVMVMRDLSANGLSVPGARGE